MNFLKLSRSTSRLCVLIFCLFILVVLPLGSTAQAASVRSVASTAQAAPVRSALSPTQAAPLAPNVIHCGGFPYILFSGPVYQGGIATVYGYCFTPGMTVFICDDADQVCWRPFAVSADGTFGPSGFRFQVFALVHGTFPVSANKMQSPQLLASTGLVVY